MLKMVIFLWQKQNIGRDRDRAFDNNNIENKTLLQKHDLRRTLDTLNVKFSQEIRTELRSQMNGITYYMKGSLYRLAADRKKEYQKSKETKNLKLRNTTTEIVEIV